MGLRGGSRPSSSAMRLKRLLMELARERVVLRRIVPLTGLAVCDRLIVAVVLRRESVYGLDIAYCGTYAGHSFFNCSSTSLHRS